MDTKQSQGEDSMTPEERRGGRAAAQPGGFRRYLFPAIDVGVEGPAFIEAAIR